MATQQEILNIFSNAGSVDNSDYFLIQTAGGQAVKVTGALVRAYLNKGIRITISDDGYLVIGDEKTTSRAEGITPQLRAGTFGIEVSYDKGKTYSTLVSYLTLARQGEVVTTEDFAAYKREQANFHKDVYRAQIMTEDEVEELTADDMLEGFLYIGWEESDEPTPPSTAWHFGDKFPIRFS